jgi:hypothetical protein
MDDTVKFVLLIAAGAIGVLLAFSVIAPQGGILTAFSAGTNAPLAANISSVVGSASTGRDTNDQSDAVLYMSYDNLRNIHPVRLPKSAGARVTAIQTTDNFQTIFMGTTRGLFISTDGGLNYRQALTQIPTSTVVLDIIPAKRAGGFYLSVFDPSQGAKGKGALYLTENNFFTAEEVTDFKSEAAYALYLLGNNLYLGMSNGQLLQYDLSRKSIETVRVFPKQITGVVFASDNFYYITLADGELYRGVSILSEFSKVRLPGGGLFSSPKLLQFAADERGGIYVRTGAGIFRSTNGGVSFDAYSNIPLLTGGIDTFGVSGGTLYILSEGRLYTSSYAGVEWQVQEVPYPRPIWNSYFIGGNRVILTQ